MGVLGGRGLFFCFVLTSHPSESTVIHFLFTFLIFPGHRTEQLGASCRSCNLTAGWIMDSKHQAQSQGKLSGLHNMPTWEIKVKHQEKEGREGTNSYYCCHKTRQVYWESKTRSMAWPIVLYFSYSTASLQLCFSSFWTRYMNRAAPSTTFCAVHHLQAPRTWELSWNLQDHNPSPSISLRHNTKKKKISSDPDLRGDLQRFCWKLKACLRSLRKIKVHSLAKMELLQY